MTTGDPPRALAAGELVDGRYRVDALIGHGAMSEVYRVHDERLDRTVALKALRPGVTDHERFVEETAVLRALDHPHLVRLHDAGQHGGMPYLVLNLVDRSLADALAGGAMPYEAVARVGREIASALGYLHGRGIVHRDVKPSNVLLREDGSACLADLGAALSSDSAGLTAPGFTVGTPRYLAPEQAVGEHVGPPADVYSLALLLIEAATGEMVFGGTPRESIAARVVTSPEVPASVPGPLGEVLQRMVAVDPHLRPDAAAVAEDLSRLPHLDGPIAVPAAAAGADATVVMGPPTLVGPALHGSGGDTEVLEAHPYAAVASAAGGNRAVGWVRADGRRAIGLGVVATIALAVLFGLASRDAPPTSPIVDSASTTSPSTSEITEPVTVPPPTTVAPVAPAPVVEEPVRERGRGNGGEGEGRQRGRDDDDD